MIEFITGKALQEAVRTITGSADACCAVAFWGQGAQDWFAGVPMERVRLICNLSMGGTNPHEIRRLQGAGAKIRMSDYLHAKVYVGPGGAVVTSANLSANGLGFEGGEQARWIEAGVLLDDPTSVQRWFEQLWDESEEVTADAIRLAIPAWEARRTHRPTLGSFVDFDIDAQPGCLITWFANESDWDFVEDTLSAFSPAHRKMLEEQIENGMELEHPDERKALRSGTWVLCWLRSKSGLPDGRSKLWWVCTDEYLRRAYKYDHEEKARDVVLARYRNPPEPFDANESRFQQAFRKAIAQPGFEELRDDYEGAWFTERRLDLIKNLWREIKRIY